MSLRTTFAPSPAPRRRRSSAGVAHSTDAADLAAHLHAVKTASGSGSPTSSSFPLTASAANGAAGVPRVRRFSLSRPRGWIDRVLDRPQVALGSVITVVFIAGTIISVWYGTSLSTSRIYHVHNSVLERTAYFARKRNLVNVIFVKRAWAWTTAAYLFHLLTTPRRADVSMPSTDHIPGYVNPALHVTSPHMRGSRAQRLAALVLASLAWILFTAWCFGAGLGDRIIAMSGGVCSVPLPKGMDNSHVQRLINPADPESAVLAAQLLQHPHLHKGDITYFPLPARYCMRSPLNPLTHPMLFKLLETTHEVHKDIHAALHLPPPRFSGGFDISGHAFLLTLGALILAAEVAPSWKAYRARGYTQRTGQKARIHAIATVLATALIGLWVWMLFMTAIYFHDVHEKLAGLFLGLVTAAIVHLSIPRSTGPVIEFKVRGPTRRPSPAPMHHHEPVHPFDKSEVEREGKDTLQLK